MKALLALVIVVTALSTNAGIIAGPVVNPANGHAYYLLSKNTWSNDEAEAVSMGGHLATIRNAGEQQWVFSSFGGYGGALWIGLTDRERGFKFTWTSDAAVLYTNWSDTQPDQECFLMIHKGHRRRGGVASTTGRGDDQLLTARETLHAGHGVLERLAGRGKRSADR